MGKKRKGSLARRANGIVCAVIVAFFCAHAVLGSVSGLTGFSSPFTWLVWAGVVLIAIHVGLSAVTSRQQLGDVERPPSARKKRHLALKWATGAVLALAACAHVVLMRTFGPETIQSHAAGAAFTVVLAAVLAVHVCVGAKSLLKDLGIDRRYMKPFRVVVVLFAIAVSAAVIAAAF